jgi:hypothetical protein
MSEYVKYRTAYHLILSEATQHASSAAESIKLGDLQVSEAAYTNSDLAKLLGLLQEHLKQAKSKLDETLEPIIPTNIVKASYSLKASKIQPYLPEYTRTPFKNIGE